MNAHTSAHTAANDARPMQLVPVPDGNGGYRNEFRPAPAEKPKGGKQRPKPDPINANPEAAAQSLKLLIERRENLEEQKSEILGDIGDVNKEVKFLGFDLKAFNSIIALRRLDPSARQEAEAILETYKCSLGIV